MSSAEPLGDPSDELETLSDHFQEVWDDAVVTGWSGEESLHKFILFAFAVVRGLQDQDR